ncbi:MAG: asparagine synthase (glutamine-hydrolyzing) [Candidatus Woesearchaeota archaeon]|nr:asparagine synthase (glutamine-hydrolyzing) [Candidatus Woesearchaeota archaeon]
MCIRDSNEGLVWITYNGEIYNFPELRKELEKKGYRFNSNTDTETIIYAYKEYGIKCLDKLNGMFAFCIYDSRKNILFLARDRIGKKPLYYYFDGKRFVFASEIKALALLDFKKEVNINALNKFMALRYNPSEETMLKGVKKLMQGHYMVFDLQKKRMIQKRRWWDIKIDIQDKTENEFAIELQRLVKDAVGRRLISDVPLGVYLSGGIDSTSIVAMMRELNADIKSFFVDFGEDKRIEDKKYSRIAAEFFNTDHKELFCKPSVKELPKICWHLDEPLADPAVIPTYLLSKLVKRHVTVILNGAGGDELFGGYQHFEFLKHRDKFNKMPNFVKKKLLPFAVKNTPSFAIERVSKFLTAFGERGKERFIDFINSSNDKAKFYLGIISVADEKERKEMISRKMNVSLIEEYRKYFSSRQEYMDQVMYLECNHFLVDVVFMNTDKTTMAFSVEARSPIVDYNIVEYAFKIPWRLKLKGEGGKYIMKKAMQPYLPKEIIKRKKQGFFVPIDSWIEGEIRDSIMSVLSEKEIKKQGLFNSRYIKKMFEGFEKSKMYYARQMWSLMVFQLWYKQYIEGIKAEKIKI